MYQLSSSPINWSHKLIVPFTCFNSPITYSYQLLFVSLTGICHPIKYSCHVFLSVTPLQVRYFFTPNCHPVSYSYQLLLSPYYTVGSKEVVGSYSLQVLISVIRISYFFLLLQLLVTGSCYYSLLCISYPLSYQLFLSTSLFSN